MTPLEIAARALCTAGGLDPDERISFWDGATISEPVRWQAHVPLAIGLLKAIRGAPSMNACLQVARAHQHLEPRAVPSDVDMIFTAVLDHIIEGKP